MNRNRFLLKRRDVVTASPIGRTITCAMVLLGTALFVAGPGCATLKPAGGERSFSSGLIGGQAVIETNRGDVTVNKSWQDVVEVIAVVVLCVICVISVPATNALVKLKHMKKEQLKQQGICK